jgi:hypothetical protein
MYVDISGASSGGGGVITQNGVTLTPGYGGRVQSYFTVAPGTLLHVSVGCQGADCPAVGTPSIGYLPGGYNGGGAGYGGSGEIGGSGGGGASDIRIGGLSLSNRVAVAGGGGGYSCAWFCGSLKGGDGDRFGHTGSSGSNSQCPSYAHNSGGGATWTAGGTAGYAVGSPAPTSGTLGYGGNSGAGNAGGGGGGYYGGKLNFFLLVCLLLELYLLRWRRSRWWNSRRRIQLLIRILCQLHEWISDWRWEYYHRILYQSDI